MARTAANLDRVRIIKGWLNSGGTASEQVYDAACSDGRASVKRACDSNVGSTVDRDTASFPRDIGAMGFAAAWQDPDFDPARDAWPYVRVLEIPTPRRTACGAVRFGIEMSHDVTVIVQDRAYTASI